MGETPGKMYALAAVLTVLAILATALRFYSRRIKKVRPSRDDYLVVLALVSTIATGVCMFVGAAIGSLGRHTQITPEGMPVFDNGVEVLFKIIFISQLTQTVTFGLTKLAVILFYRRIFITRTFSVISWVMTGLASIWTIAFFAANLLQCLPISENWSSLGAAPGTCIRTTMMYLAQAWSDVFTDVVILSMPLPWLWRLQMAPMRKFFVVLIFQLGALVVCAGAAKLVVFHRIVYSKCSPSPPIFLNQQPQRILTTTNLQTPLQETKISHVRLPSHPSTPHLADHPKNLLTPTVYWPMVESSLGIVGACLPLLRPIFTDTPAKNIFSSLRAMMSRSSLRSNSANTESLDCAKLEAGSLRAPQMHKFEEGQML